MDGLIPLIFKVLKKKKAMRYYRSLSSSSSFSSFSGAGGPPRIDVVAAATMTPRDQKLKVVVTKAGGGVQRVAAMEALPRETFSPRLRGGGGGAAVAPAIVGRSYLGGK